MKIKIYSKVEIEFLVKNYPKFGTKYCSKELNRSENSIRKKCFQLKLKVDKYGKIERFKKSFPIKNNNQYSVNPEQFFNITTPEISYILGFLWADGTVLKSKRDNKVILALKKDDFEEIELILQKIGIWRISYKYKNHDKWSEQGVAQISNKPLVNFLVDNDYKSKSNCSADKILSKIPEHLKHYWFRGLSDGDGCIFVNKTTTYADFSISSSYNQDWNYIFKIFHQLNINGRISKQVNKIGRNSQIHIGNIIDIIKFLNYIYKNYESDNLFLKRKLDKYFLCKIILNNLKRKYKTTGISKSGDSFYVNFYFNKIRYYLGHFNNINLAIKAKKDKARELMPKDEFNLIYN